MNKYFRRLYSGQLFKNTLNIVLTEMNVKHSLLIIISLLEVSRIGEAIYTSNLFSA